jgi:hypothetical protein
MHRVRVPPAASGGLAEGVEEVLDVVRSWIAKMPTCEILNTLA